MKSALTQVSSHACTAAISDITDTDPNCGARTAIVCDVKVVNRRQACMRILAKIEKVDKKIYKIIAGQSDP